MRNLVLLLFLIGSVVSESHEQNDHAWKPGTEYHYLVRSRTVTALDKLANQYTGIMMKGQLTVQAKDQSTLRAKLSKAQYAQIHTTLPEGWESRIPDEKLELQEMPMSKTPFEIKVKHGVVRDLIVDKSMPTWEVNVLKSIVSQLQVDTQGENAKPSKSDQVPEEHRPFAMFKAMEDSVGGKCEVLYDITPLSEFVLQSQPELVPLPELKSDGMHIDIMKTKNYNRCEQRMSYHYGITGNSKWEPGSNDNGEFLSKSSTSRIIISGHMKSFTIQSSVTTNKMFVSPRMNDHQTGMVISKMNLTLAKVDKATDPLEPPRNPESTGNLVYTYNNPFSETDQRKPGRPTISQDSKGAWDSKSSAGSSEENNRSRHASDNSISSSRGSRSSISSSEEEDFWQRKPSLEEAPESPLLPYFIGDKGKSIRMSQKINPVQATKDLVDQIAEELHKPDTMPTRHTLEKFTILSSLIRTMDKKQITEVDRMVPLSSDQINPDDNSKAKEAAARSVFRDAVAEAGTGPAFLIIKDWIQSRKVEGFEAAGILAQMSNSVRTPTSEYIEEFFSLVKSSEVMNQNFLNTTALVAFTDLVRDVQINHESLHNRFPVHSFGRMSSKHNQAVFKEYIPYLAQQLKKAIKDGDSPKIQAYIIALGNIGHPKILGVFEPYIEGKEQVSTFQRFLMVMSMGKLASFYPKIAQSVLFKIYLNTREAHEVRCAAVAMLMKAKPTMSMLQRMAEFTRYDKSKQVNSAVKSAIESAARLTRADLRELARNARAAKNLLTKETYSYQFSKNFMEDSINTEKHLDYWLTVNMLGSDDIDIPRAIYINVDSSYDSFKAPILKLGGMVSSIRKLLQRGNQWSQDKERDPRMSAVEKIAKMLNIEPEDSEQLEGNMFLNNQYLTFDNHTIDRIPQLLMTAGKRLKEGKEWNCNKFWSYELTLSFPTESGLPFLYSLKVPKLHKTSGKAKAESRPNMDMHIKAEIHMLHARNMQGRIGFMTPFDHQQFISGVDVNGQIRLSAKVDLDVSPSQKRIEMKVRPVNNDKIRLAHYSFVPFTSKHDILNLQPVPLDMNTHAIHVSKPNQVSFSYPSNVDERIQLKMEGDDLDMDTLFNLETQDPLQQLLFPWSQNSGRYRNFDLYVKGTSEEEDTVTLTATYASMNFESQDWRNSGDKEMKAMAPETSDKKPDSVSRRKQLLQDAAKGINSARSQILDLGLELPGEMRYRQVLTLAWARSNVDDRSRGLMYWHLNVPERNIDYEVCVGAEAEAPEISLLDYEKAIKTDSSRKFDVNVRFGSKCSEGGEVRIKGLQTQSDDMKSNVDSSPVTKKCREEMKEGNKALRACQKASQAAVTLNEMKMDIEFDENSKMLKIFATKAIDMSKSMAYPNVYVDPFNPRVTDDNRVQVMVNISPDFGKAQVGVFTSNMDVLFPDVSLSETIMDNHPARSANGDVETWALWNQEEDNTCVLDTNKAVSFDDRTFPVKLGKCSHVAMTTYPKADPDNREKSLHIPEDMKVSVLARETEDGKKEVKIILGDREIRLSPSASKPQVTVDGQNINYSRKQSYQQRQKIDNIVEFEIFELADSSAKVTSEKYRVNIIFDGQRVKIEASEKYRNSVRGLCGNFDGEPENDFTTPKNCLLKRPEEFAATYALTQDMCEGPVLANLKKAGESVCLKLFHSPSDVISDWEAGRPRSDDIQKWGYHDDRRSDEKQCHTYRTGIVMKDNQICFTTRPMPSCTSNCKASEKKLKKYNLHCMPENEASLEMKRRVEQGANPDLSQKPISTTESMEVPVSCRRNV